MMILRFQKYLKDDVWKMPLLKKCPVDFFTQTQLHKQLVVLTTTITEASKVCNNTSRKQYYLTLWSIKGLFELTKFDTTWQLVQVAS